MSIALTIVLTLVLVSAGYGFLLYLVCRRVALHIQGDIEATRAVVDNVLVPMLGRKTKPAEGV